MSSIDSTIQNTLSFLDNEYVNVAVCAALVLYTGFVAPKMPGHLPLFFNNEWFNLVLIALIAIVSKKDTTIAILLAVAFIVSLVALNRLVSASSVYGKGEKCNCGANGKRRPGYNCGKNNGSKGTLVGDVPGYSDKNVSVLSVDDSASQPMGGILDGDSGMGGEDYEQVSNSVPSNASTANGYASGDTYASV